MFQPHVLRILFLNFVIDQQHAWTRLAWATRKRRKQGNHFCVKTNLFFSFFFSLILNVSNEKQKNYQFLQAKVGYCYNSILHTKTMLFPFIIFTFMLSLVSSILTGQLGGVPAMWDDAYLPCNNKKSECCCSGLAVLLRQFTTYE